MVGVTIILTCVCVFVCYKAKKQKRRKENASTVQEEPVYDTILTLPKSIQLQPTIEGKPTQCSGRLFVSENPPTYCDKRECIPMNDNALYNAPIALISVRQQANDDDIDYYI